MGDLMKRPGVRLYLHEGMAWRRLYAEQAEPYDWGYTAAELDLAAGLAPMTNAEHAHTWHGNYAEGYRDHVADNADDWNAETA